MSIDKAAPYQLGNLRMEQVEVRGIFGWSHGHTWCCSVREATQCYALFNWRWIALSQPLCPEGVVALHQQLEDQNPQAKGILLRGANCAVKRLTLQFGRSVFWLGHRTGIGHHLAAARFLHLKRVGVNQGDQR